VCIFFPRIVKFEGRLLEFDSSCVLCLAGVVTKSARYCRGKGSAKEGGEAAMIGA
jgi:hypothetical protein